MPKPNMVIVLDVPVEVSVLRKTERDIIEQDISYLRKVRATYTHIASTKGWYVVDGTGAPEVVHSDIMKLVNDEFQWNIKM